MPIPLKIIPLKLLFACSLAVLCQRSPAQEKSNETDSWQTPYELSDGWDSVDYLTAIDFYQRLANAFDRVQIRAAGRTDSGFPLHVVTISNDGNFDIQSAKQAGRSVLLINNAIHPGESDGVDAAMMFVRDLAINGLPDNVIVTVIPLYNIGGALNRNSGTRANQNGPREYGFRGNAQNYDLNRDFIKCDSINARSFAEIFHQLDPELFLDTHVSNGADYQHVMTTSQSQKDKLGLSLGSYLSKTFQPELFAAMAASGFETIPYVNSGGSPPDRGFPQFLETPRYSTGYTGLFQTMGFMTETHMLKPYPQRVKATRAFMDHSLALLSKRGKEIQAIRAQDRRQYRRQTEVAIAWSVDRQLPSKLRFSGYEASRVPSKVTPGNRLFYDRNKPFTKEIDYFDRYVPSKTVTLPKGYLIPRGWHRVIELMKINQVEMMTVTKETTVPVQQYRFGSVSSRSNPYEGHYFHDEVDLQIQSSTITARVGDVVIPIDQDRARYVVETLEPAAMDSLFRWNYFDTVLQQKEHFSPYVFEESASKMLANNAELRERFDAKKQSDKEFATSRDAQLEFLYENSVHYEKAYRTYPISRLMDGTITDQAKTVR